MGQNIIKYRHNIMAVHTLEAFGNIVGGVRQTGNQTCKDVYFIRALGMGTHYREDVLKLEDTMTKRMLDGRLVYTRTDVLPAFPAEQDTAFYAECFARWQDSGRKRMETRCSQKAAGLPEVLGNAAASAVEKFRIAKPNASETIVKNFVVKLCFWFDIVMGDLLTDWNERSNIKLAAQNISKEQEYLFYYMLTLIGADVILLQNRMDIVLAQELKELSMEISLGRYAEIQLPQYTALSSSSKSAATGRVSGKKTVAENPQADQARIKVVIPAKPGRKTSVPSLTVPPARSSPGTVRSTTSGSAVPAPGSVRQEKSFEELALLASSVVMITIHDQAGNPIGSGSGIMIGQAGYILTNNHVASGGRFYSVKIEDDDKSYDTDEVVKYHSVFDLAVLRINRALNPIPVYRGSQKLVRGQRVVAIGSPLGLFNSVSNGIISGFRLVGNVDMIQFTAPTSHGSSGGAVLNMYGEVIGISTAGIDDGQNINLAVGYECINMFIKGFT